MNIILIGMRGSGKSTVGKLLAEKLNKRLIEIDILIEKEIGEIIKDYVKKNGWDNFRDTEEKVISKAGKLDNIIISCGGGIVERNENVINLKRNGFLVYLKANIETLLKRIGEDESRPYLTKTDSMKQDLKNILQKRGKLYEKSADLIVTSDNKNIAQIRDEIINILIRKHIL